MNDKMTFSEHSLEKVSDVMDILNKLGFKKILLEPELINTNDKIKGIDAFMNLSGILVLGLHDGKKYLLMEAHANAKEVSTEETVPVSLKSVPLGGSDLKPFLHTLQNLVLNGSYVMPWVEKPTDTMYTGFEAIINYVNDKMILANQKTPENKSFMRSA